jgi:hypothetical protein
MSRKWSQFYPEKGLVMDVPIDTSANTTADNLAAGSKVNGVVIVPQETITRTILAASVDEHIWIAPFACQVVSVKEIHSVVGGGSAAVRPRKITDTSAPGAAAGATVTEITTAGFDLTATVNTTQTGTLSATAADYTLAAGDKISLDFSGTLTGLVGIITIAVKAV